jgi:hypothetical protein
MDRGPAPTRTKTRLSSIAVAILLAAFVGGCGTGPAATAAVQSPVDTVYTFFKALNSGDMQLADAHLALDSVLPRGGDAPPRNLYANLSCRPGSEFNSDSRFRDKGGRGV